jgi:hypothetical protein
VRNRRGTFPPLIQHHFPTSLHTRAVRPRLVLVAAVDGRQDRRRVARDYDALTAGGIGGGS